MKTTIWTSAAVTTAAIGIAIFTGSFVNMAIAAVGSALLVWNVRTYQADKFIA